MKTELMAVEETLRRLDVKVRLASELVRRQFGARPGNVARLLVLPRTTTAWRRMRRHEATFGVALPGQSTEARRWLAAPRGSFAGVLLVADMKGSGAGSGRSTAARAR